MRPEIKKKTLAFLERHGLLADCIDREKALSGFMLDMERVAGGGQGSVKMIPSWVGVYVPEEKHDPVIVLDIGGTNVRSAVVSPDEKGLGSIMHLPSFLTPGIEEETDTASFFLEIARRVSSSPEWNRVYGEEGALRGAGNLSICFSLATVPQKDRDAVMVAGGKQIRIRDMIGQKVGASFTQALRSLGKRHDMRITVTNDSVAAALAGYLYPSGISYSGYIGFIYGTGTNLCYREKTGEMINVESGAYCSFPTGDIDDLFDSSLIDTGHDRFEKMVSGGYQGGLMQYIMQAAVHEGLLSRPFFRQLFSEGPLDAGQISAFANDPEGDGRIAAALALALDPAVEREALLLIVDQVTGRSACLCSIALTGVLLRAGIGTLPDAPAFIMAEGSTYLKQKDFRPRLEQYMQELAAEQHQLFYEFHTMEDAVLKGTAVASLSN